MLAQFANLNLYDISGLCGVAAYIGAYFGVQVGRLKPESIAFSVLNLIGPLLVLVSLTDAFNLASFVAQSFWVAITLLGLFRRYRASATMRTPMATRKPPR
jgi:hypothetical protein